MKIQERFQFILIFILSLCLHPLVAQVCNPNPAPNCRDALTICSLSELNGYQCRTGNTNAVSSCFPICTQGNGGLKNTNWHAFVTEGGNTCLEVEVTNSQQGRGIQIGLYADCSCQYLVACDVGCHGVGKYRLCADLIPCKVYFLYIDGCNGDISDYTIHTIAGNRPTLDTIGFINNEIDQVIDVCLSQNGTKFFTDSLPNNCQPTYIWKLDTFTIPNYERKTEYTFTKEGTYKLCVTANLGNPYNKNFCYSTPQKCATIKVKKLPEVFGPTISLCPEDPFVWEGKPIVNNKYTYQKIDPNGCYYDSTIFFKLYPVPIPPYVYFIGCENDIYIDPISGKSYLGCNDNVKVLVPNSTPNGCDSSYLLTTAYPTFKVQWNITCFGGGLELLPTVQISGECGASYTETYKWYKKSLPNIIIGTDPTLRIPAIQDEYCFTYAATFHLGTETVICTEDFCDPFNESTYLPKKVTLKGPTNVCIGKSEWYSIDAIISGPKPYGFNWRVTGGKILTKNPFDTTAIEILWNGPSGKSGEVCVDYETDCGQSPETCLTITQSSNNAYKVPLVGDLNTCIGNIYNYKIDTILPIGILGYNWKVTGGTIITPNPFDKSSIDIKWNGPSGKSGEVCISYESDCGTSPETCLIIDEKIKPDPKSGGDISICGLTTFLNVTQDKGGFWTQLSGPTQAIIENPTDPKSKITTTKYGTYVFSWTEGNQNCTTTITQKVIFGEDPEAINISISKLADSLHYVLQFDLVKGIKPYTLLYGKGEIINAHYTSDTLTGSKRDTIIIIDSAGCAFAYITDIFTKNKNLNLSDACRIYPNPFTDELILEFNNSTTTLADIKIYNDLGKVLFYEHDQFTIPNNKLKLNVTNLSVGIYFIEIRTEKKYWLSRIIKN